MLEQVMPDGREDAPGMTRFAAMLRQELIAVALAARPEINAFKP